VAAAADLMHKSGILHGDIKAGNVMLELGPAAPAEATPLGLQDALDRGLLHAVVGDFGLALCKQLEDKAWEQEPLAGTLVYMAPEVSARMDKAPGADPSVKYRMHLGEWSGEWVLLECSHFCCAVPF
jgi:serine/threonine protein kinase